MDTSLLLLSAQFEDVPESQLRWLLEKGKIKTLQPGDFLFKKGDPPTYLYVVLSGSFQVYFLRGNQQRFVPDIEPGRVTGLLPYSRMVETSGSATANTESEVFVLHKDHFPEMIRDHYDLTSFFVHQMTNRVRTFTQIQLQNEKLMALGKLSAGLAHELNNPASAIVRSSKALKSHLELLPENFKKVIKIQATDEQVDRVNQLLFERISDRKPNNLSLMEKSDREDEIADWLEENGVEDGFEIAENLVEFGLKESDLQMVIEAVSEAHFPPVAKWINDNLTTDRMVREIEDAACRISDLVLSVKGYTHMDQASAIQPVDLPKGLLSTQTMLKYKARQNQIEFINDFDENLPPIQGIPGEINQVFTNLIDNGLDAMEKKGGTLTCKTWLDGNSARISITDTGTGIPKEIQRNIYEPFYTTKEMGKGTGMGLEVVRNIVIKHRGSIDLESVPGKTTFKLCFPIDQ